MGKEFNNEQIADLKEAFEIFDQGGKGLININNAGLIRRAVSQNPASYVIIYRLVFFLNVRYCFVV